LAAAAAWRQDAAATIAHGDDLRELTDAVRDRSTDDDELGAQPAGEVVDVDAGHDPAIEGARGGSHRVVPVVCAGGDQLRRCLDELAIDFRCSTSSIAWAGRLYRASVTHSLSCSR
jgi:hypothetical protein